MCAGQFDERGFLTERDIKFLQDVESPGSSEQKSRARRDIRERVVAAMHDFEILLEHWPEDQQKETLALIGENSEKSFEELGADMIGFLYMLANVGNTQPDLIRNEDSVRQLLRFRSSLSEGIRKGKGAFGHSPGVVGVAATTPLFETPDPERVREEVDSQELTAKHQDANNKFEWSVAYEDDEAVIDMDNREAAIRELLADLEEELAFEVARRRKEADEFVYPPEFSVSSTFVHRYNAEYNRKSED